MTKKRESEWWFNRYIDFLVAHGRLDNMKPYDGRFKVVYGKDSVHIVVNTSHRGLATYRWSQFRPRIITYDPVRNHGRRLFLTRKSKHDNFIKHFHKMIEYTCPCPVCGYRRRSW